jgi:cysteine desulfurase
MVYLDYAATSPILPEVKTAMWEAMNAFYGNASALHTPGHSAKSQIEKTRAKLAALIGAKPEEIIFTSGSSESNNTVMHIFEGCQIETSPLEHHSVIRAADFYRGEKLPKLYSYMLANNEIGEILELPSLKRERLEKSDLFNVQDDWGHPLVTDCRTEYLHSDLTQVLGKIPIDINKLGLDYATFSAHKIGGPIGVGALYMRSGVPFKPLIFGDQENKRRGGTYDTVGIIGFGVALDKISGNFQRYDTEVRKLRNTLAQRILDEIPGSSLNTDINRGKSLPNILNVSFRAAEGESIQLYLDNAGVIVSTGSACASGDIKPSRTIMAKTGDAEIAHSSIRFSLGIESTMADIDAVMDVLPDVINKLQQMSTLS